MTWSLVRHYSGDKLRVEIAAYLAAAGASYGYLKTGCTIFSSAHYQCLENVLAFLQASAAALARRYLALARSGALRVRPSTGSGRPLSRYDAAVTTDDNRRLGPFADDRFGHAGA